MIIGFSGAHRTGKTTLAAKLAEDLKIQFRVTSMSQVFKDVGVGVNDDLDFDTRMIVQDEMLNRLVALYGGLGSFTTDRTPLDIIAYTYLNLPRMLTAEQQEVVRSHVERAFEATKLLPLIIRVPPGITIVEDPTKAVGQVHYIETLDALIAGLSRDARCASAAYYFERRIVDLGDRVRLSGNIVKNHVQQVRESLTGVALH